MRELFKTSCKTLPNLPTLTAPTLLTTALAATLAATLLLMIFLLDLTHVSISDPTSSSTSYYSTGDPGVLSGNSTQYVPALRADDEIGSKSISLGLSLGSGGSSTGPSPPRDVTVRILHEVAGQNRVSAIDPSTRNLLGQAAYLRGVGTGGDGTVYNSSSPFVIANGKVIRHKRVGKAYDLVKIRPHSDAFRATVPRGSLVGYPDGLRFDGNSAEAEITGYTSVPAKFTLGAQVLSQREWAVGVNNTQTIAGTRSARLYFTKGTNEYARQLHFDYETSLPSTVTIDGPTFDADESVKAITARVDTSPATGDIEVEFGIDQSFSTVNGSGGALSATAEAWKLGRFRTSTTDTADTIIGGWFLFDTLLDDKTVISYNTRRLTGDEDNLIWYYPGVAVGGSLLDLAAANASSPLDATITGATAAPLFLGTPELAGAVMPTGLGYIQNAPLTAIDPARKIYRGFYDPISAIITVQDRQVPYDIEAVYESPLDFADNPPINPGGVTVTPWMGGLVRVHTEVDGVENTADVLGHSVWDDAVTLGRSFDPGGGDPRITIAGLDTIYNAKTWGIEIFLDRWDDPVNQVSVIGRSNVFDMRTIDDQFPGSGKTRLRTQFDLDTGGPGAMEVNFIANKGSSYMILIEAWESGGDVYSRLTVNGKVLDTDFVASDTLKTSLGGPSPTTVGFASGGMDMSVLPLRAWSAASATDEDAESRQRQYMFSNPATSHPDLYGLWHRYTTDRTVLVDETSNSNDGTVESGALWTPGVAATDRLSAAHYLLDKSSTSITFDDTAYDYDPSAISYHIAGGQTSPPGAASATPTTSSSSFGTPVASAAAAVLAGDGLYLLLDPDGTALIGQIQDPATATPSATIRVEFATFLDEADYNFQPSVIEALYAPNPVVQSSVLSGADSDRRSFAERPYRSLDEPVGDNRSLYDDDPVPGGRRSVLDTKFVNRSPAQATASRVAAQWDTPRPTRNPAFVGKNGDRDFGYSSYLPGDIVKIQHERLPGGEVTVLITDVQKSSPGDLLTVR